MGRVLGIDFGMKRIGLARSDPMKMIASPLKTISAGKSLEETADLILKELEGVETIVLGLPLLLSGKDSETTTTVRKFAEILEKKSGLPLILWDERLTSKQVEKLMIEGQVSRKKRSSHVDTMSATLILQNYLDGSFHEPNQH
ncbi:MAG: Holliday junction resolvase RuvX [Chlamydiales bacterium]|nr:Holliday junction resolvase RuvX [Chlamydiales bacterium]